MSIAVRPGPRPREDLEEREGLVFLAASLCSLAGGRILDLGSWISNVDLGDDGFQDFVKFTSCGRSSTS